MEEKKKIIFYVDWTDCLAHLTGDESYSEGDTKKDQANYTRTQVNNFFQSLTKISKNYDVDIHCITGGTIEYLNKNGNGWIKQIHELFTSSGFPDTFKSVVTEYGADLLIGEKSILLEKPFEPSKTLCTEELLRNIYRQLPNEIVDLTELSLYKYFANIRFEKEDMTENEFKYYYSIIKEFKNTELYDKYPYYCPGYGVEIDVLPKGLNKERAVKSINESFYSNTPRENIALSVFNGDFAEIDLRMIDHSLTDDVLFVGSEDANIKPYVENTPLPYRIEGHKIEAITNVMEEIATNNLEQHPYVKKGYHYGR